MVNSGIYGPVSYLYKGQIYTNKCMNNQVCKLFALADGVGTRDMSAIPQYKQLSNYCNY